VLFRFLFSAALAAFMVSGQVANAENIPISWMTDTGSGSGSSSVASSGSLTLSASGSLLSLPVADVAAALSDIRHVLFFLALLSVAVVTYAFLSSLFD